MRKPGFYSFDVWFSTHEHLQRGIPELDFHRVTIAANRDVEAACIAAQLVATAQGVIPTRTALIDWQEAPDGVTQHCPNGERYQGIVSQIIQPVGESK